LTALFGAFSMQHWQGRSLNMRRGISDMTAGWDASAQAWIDTMGVDGDWGRRYVLDLPMLERVDALAPKTALDLGCGEGRFCRMMQELGVRTMGLDPTSTLIGQARSLDPAGDYRIGMAEALDLPSASFDLVVSYLSLVDIDDLDGALSEVERVLRPGGHFLIANLQGFNTAAVAQGWTREPDGSQRFSIDHYLEERPTWIEWNGIRIQNWHRPLSRYMSGLIDLGFHLTHFSEPGPVGVADDKADRYRRAPNFLIMEWRKG
jgi:SAM-dependent methyltransferase